MAAYRGGLMRACDAGEVVAPHLSSNQRRGRARN